MSLFVPTQRQGEYSTRICALLARDQYPLARAYVASTFAQVGRMEEAERIMSDALAAAPNDARVIRRAAKLDTNHKNVSKPRSKNSSAQSLPILMTR